MKNKINELQVSNPPQPPLTNDTQSFVRQSLKKGGGRLLFEKLDNPAFSEKVLSPFTSHLSHKRRAFMLAEVLITLGIIGVVAALTLPTLIQNYQKQVYVNQLKKAYSTISQGIQKAMADAGVDDIRNTSIIRSSYAIDVDMDEVKKYFNIVDNAGNQSSLGISYKTLSGNSTSFLQYANASILQDGTIIYWGHSTGTPNNDFALIIGADVNGKKGPNQLGRDFFNFALLLNGKLVPLSFSSCSGDWGHGSCNYQDNMNGDSLSDTCNTSDTGENAGADCAHRIINDGWKMNY